MAAVKPLSCTTTTPVEKCPSRCPKHTTRSRSKQYQRHSRLSRRFLVAAPLVLSSLAVCGPKADADQQVVPTAKRTGLSVEEVKDILEADFKERRYFVTGDLTTEVFADNCRFRDPTNDTTGLNNYVKALKILFDPQNSDVTLKNIRVTGRSTIEADWILGGYLQFPWNPKIPPVNGTSVYHLNDEGLIQFIDETWDTPGWKALLASFTPQNPP